MRPDVQQDPRPEFGIPVARDTAAGRYDDGQAPWSGPQPTAAPRFGAAPGPYSQPQPAVGPYSGPQAAARPTTGSFVRAADYGRPSDPTVRRSRAEAPGYESTAYEPAGYESARYDSTGYEPAGYEPPAGYDPRDVHPSGPLPVGSGHRRDERRGTGKGRRRAVLALIAAGAVVAGAAGYVAIAHWGASSSQPTAPAAGAQVAASALSGPNLATRETPLGLVATSDGFTVYEYTKDTSKPPKATCTDACATAWPPVLASDTPWLKGVSADKVGTVDRPDGTKQLTLNGWPLYRYGKDTAPGDTNGNGVGGTWKALGPDGKPVAPNAPAAKTGATNTGGGSGAAAPAAPAAPAQAPASSGGSSYGSSGSAGGGSSYGSGGY
jgi:predicted lipoprotein with Yx(FWY)xxD motif